METTGSLVKINADYQAVKEDEISVSRNETVTVLSSNQHNMLLVFREANHSSPAAEGWIPGHLVGTPSSTKDVGDNGFRKSWALKLRKPSLGSRKEMKTGSLDRGTRKEKEPKTPVKVSVIYMKKISSHLELSRCEFCHFHMTIRFP